MKEFCNKKTFNNFLTFLKTETFKDFVIVNAEVSAHFAIKAKENTLLHAINHKAQQDSSTKIENYFCRVNYKFLRPLWVLYPTQERTADGEIYFNVCRFDEVINSKSAFYRTKDALINAGILAHLQNYAGYKVADEASEFISEVIKNKTKRAEESEFGTNYANKKGYKEDTKIFKKFFEIQGGKNNYFYKVKDLLSKLNFTKFKGWKFAALTAAQHDTLIKKGTNANYFIKLKLSNTEEVYALNLPSAENIKKECRKVVCTKEQAIKQIQTAAKKIRLSNAQKNILYYCNLYTYDLKREEHAQKLAFSARCKDIKHLYTELQKLIENQFLTNKNGVLKTNFNAIFALNYFNKLTTVKEIKKASRTRNA